MDRQTPNLELPFILAAQAQKHVTHNEALLMLDSLTQIGVLDHDLAQPPTESQFGDRYIIATGAGGAWSGNDGKIAVWWDGAWRFFSPKPGWIAWVVDLGQLVVWTGGMWTPVVAELLGSLPTLGINATASTTNRLAVSAASSLFGHDGGGHRVFVNKSAIPETASVVFQTNYSGRAEIGTAGDDRLRVKVSADGSAWQDAIVVEHQSGFTSLKAFDSLQVVIAHGAVGVVPLPSAGGLLAVSLVHESFPQAHICGFFSYDAGTTPSLIGLALGSGVANLNTTLPSGATGASGKVSLAVDSARNLHIENRVSFSTAPQQFSLTFFGGYRSVQ